jgi:hypothetical protein
MANAFMCIHLKPSVLMRENGRDEEGGKKYDEYVRRMTTRRLDEVRAENVRRQVPTITEVRDECRSTDDEVPGREGRSEYRRGTREQSCRDTTKYTRPSSGTSRRATRPVVLGIKSTCTDEVRPDMSDEIRIR